MLNYYIGVDRQPRQFCETSAEVTNYVIAFYETGNLGPQKLNFDVSPSTHIVSNLSKTVRTDQCVPNARLF